MKTDEQILEELRAASDGLLMMSESDYPFELIRGLPKQLGEGAEERVEIKSVDDFFRPAVRAYEGMRDEDLVKVDRYRKLVELLKENLSDVKVYKVGAIKIAVYIVGRSPSGSWLGLSTQTVET